MGDELKTKMLKTLTWVSIDKFGQQLAQLFIGIVLARLLTPHDYGLIGVLMIFIALSSVMIDGGFGQALIRKQDATPTDFSTIFYLNLSISVLLYIILFFSAPLIANFFLEPQIIKISRVLFLTILFYAIYFVQYVVLNKKLDFKKLALINISSVVVSGALGIALAFNGYGVWALVWQQIASQLIRAILFPILVHWRPIRIFSFQVIKDFWNFSIHMLGSTSLNVIFNHIYTILLGRFYPLQVGYYAQANKLNETVNAASQQILLSGTYPLLVQIQDDTERLTRIFRRLTKSVSLLVFPLTIVLIAIAKPFILVLIHEQWLSSVILFQLLLAASIFGPLYSLNISVLNARGESKKTLRIEFIKKTLILISLVFCFQYGISSMLIGLIIATYLSYFISIVYIRKVLALKLRSQFSDILPNLLLSILLGGVTAIFAYLSISNNLLLVSIQIVTAGIMYLLMVRFIYPEIFFNALNFIREKIGYALSFIKK
jgi:O-antigen/teichoic acid export membrane protein